MAAIKLPWQRPGGICHQGCHQQVTYWAYWCGFAPREAPRAAELLTSPISRSPLEPRESRSPSPSSPAAFWQIFISQRYFPIVLAFSHERLVPSWEAIFASSISRPLWKQGIDSDLLWWGLINVPPLSRSPACLTALFWGLLNTWCSLQKVWVAPGFLGVRSFYVVSASYFLRKRFNS